MKNGVAAGFEMLDIADRFCFLLLARAPSISFNRALRSPSGRRRRSSPPAKQQIERIEDELTGLAIGDRGLQRRKIRRAVVVKCDDLTVDQRIRQRASLFGDRLKLLVQSSPFGFSACGAVLDPQLHAVTVELISWHHPSAAGGRSTDMQSCGAMKSGIVATFLPLADAERDAATLFSARAAAAIAPVRIPDWVGVTRRTCRHEASGALPLPRQSRPSCAPMDRSIAIQDIVGVAFSLRIRRDLDQQPVGALAAMRSCACDQHPAACSFSPSSVNFRCLS